MLIKIKDKEGQVFSSDMKNEFAIIEMHFCTSYTQAIVQFPDEEGYQTKDIIIPTEKNDLESAIDFIAVSEDEIGSFVVGETI